VNLEPPSQESARPVSVLLLDDDSVSLHLRGAILRQHGYACLTASTVEEATDLLDQTDIAVLDYHLGHGKFGTEVATALRKRRPQVPIVIMSATLERRFGGVEDMHLLKGHSSVDDLLGALSSFNARRRGVPVVVDARDFFYSRISLAIGTDVLVQVFDADGTWQYCNEFAAEHLGHPRDWFTHRNIFLEMPNVRTDWVDVLATVANTRETYIDRTRKGLFYVQLPGEPSMTWSVLVFPITLHDGRRGAVLTARVLEKNPSVFA
jgi:two-component system, OmpR family, response regulator